MSSVLKICEKCDSGYAGSVCLKCGNFTEPAVSDAKPQKEDFGFLTSAIIENNSKVDDNSRSFDKKKRKFIFPFILGLILLSIGSYAYWLFVYTTPNYVSPYVLSASDSRPGFIEDEVVVEVSDPKEKAIPLDINHNEGSFDQYDFAQFASPDTSLMVSAFNLPSVLSKYFEDEDIIKNIKEEFDVSDNDIDVFFSKEFAIFIPGEDFSKWGIAVYTADKSFVDSKVEILNKNREKSKFVFKDYFADVVEVKPEEEDAKSEYFLLVSNSKEYLDQMKESSEGNLTNLATDIKYSTIKAELPKVGQVFVYRKEDASVWNLFISWIATKYDYIGLDKILMAIDAPGVVFFSSNSKLKITTADIM